MGKFDTEAFLLLLKVIATFITISMCCYGCCCCCTNPEGEDELT
jgi:hypothetical protein